MPKSTLTSKGQVTIPKSLRDRFGLQPGDLLEFREDDQGMIRVQPLSDPRGALGALRHRAGARPVTVDEMRRAVHSRAAAEGKKSQ